VGGSKPVGSRFQVETRKTKWRPIINISQNALFSEKNRGKSSQLTLFHSRGYFYPSEWNRVNGKLTSVNFSYFFAATRNSRAFSVGGSKPVGSRFQVETRKTKWKPKINISQNALFRRKTEVRVRN